MFDPIDLIANAIPVLFWLVLAFVVAIISRQIFLWYAGINDMIQRQDRIIELLEKSLDANKQKGGPLG